LAGVSIERPSGRSDLCGIPCPRVCPASVIGRRVLIGQHHLCRRRGLGICFTDAAGTAGVVKARASESVSRALSEPTATFRSRARDTASTNQAAPGRAIKAGTALRARLMMHARIANRASTMRLRAAARSHVGCIGERGRLEPSQDGAWLAVPACSS
jgi:hypothetical protein